MKKSFRAVVSGDVQGVGYRYTVYNIAQRFKIAGSVRNLDDGTVEVQAEGEGEELEKFLNAIELKDGWIRVGKIAAEWGKYEGRFRGFSILRGGGF
jgi:acylphosphatase